MITILEIDSDDWPYVIKDHEGIKLQSPVDINTKHAKRRYLPFLRYSGYWAFDRATMEITNTGHTGTYTSIRI